MQDTPAREDSEFLAAEQNQANDPVVKRLWISLAALVVVLLFAVLYVVVAGFINPAGPRTAVEARLLLSGDAAKQQPQSGEARFDYILSLAVVGRNRVALDEVNQAKKDLKGLELPYAYLAEASVLFGQGKYDQAVKAADVGIKVKDTAVAAEVAKFAEKKIKMDPESLSQNLSVRLLMVKAQSLARRGRTKDSLVALTAALKADPLASDVLVLRAKTYQELGETGKARADFQTALKYIPDFEPALSGLRELDGTN